MYIWHAHACMEHAWQALLGATLQESLHAGGGAAVEAEAGMHVQAVPAAHRGFLARARSVPIEALYEHACRQGRRLVLSGAASQSLGSLAWPCRTPPPMPLAMHAPQCMYRHCAWARQAASPTLRRQRPTHVYMPVSGEVQ